jgi:hypothetical protein
MLSRPTLGPTQPPIQWLPEALSSGVKRQGREADHSPPVSVEVKKMWIYTSTSPYGVVLNQLSTGTTLPYLFMYLFKGFLWSCGHAAVNYRIISK